VRALPAVIALLLAACSSAPAPAWQVSAHDQLANFTATYLAGDDRFAAAHFEKALTEIAKTGDPALMGRALLIRCAVGIAALTDGDCAVGPVYLKDPENAAYLALLAGRSPAVKDLPKRYRAFAEALGRGRADTIAAEVAAIDEPVSRLVAVGVAVHRGLFDAALLETGATTASENGWKRPLSAYLLRLKALYEAAGDTTGSASVEARLSVIEQGAAAK